MTKKASTFSTQFTKKLAKLVKQEKARAKKQKLTMDEFNAIITITFYLLGQNHKIFFKRASNLIKNYDKKK